MMSDDEQERRERDEGEIFDLRVRVDALETTLRQVLAVGDALVDFEWGDNDVEAAREALALFRDAIKIGPGEWDAIAEHARKVLEGRCPLTTT